MRQTPVNDYLEDISTELPEEIYGRLSDAIYETVCEFDEEVAQLQADNAKLRELARDMTREHECCYLTWPAAITVRMRELGIEVDA